MIRRSAPLEPVAYVQQVEEPLRCRCPICLVLDARHPTEGFQLHLFPYVVSTRSR